jgi:hypothetical protein
MGNAHGYDSYCNEANLRTGKAAIWSEDERASGWNEIVDQQREFVSWSWNDSDGMSTIA